MTEKYNGILLIGHGTREASGTEAFLDIVEHTHRLMPDMPMQGAFLEFARPTIAEALLRLVWEEATHIAVVPIFLSKHGHTMDDIPEAIAKAAGQFYEGSEFKVKGSEMVLERDKNVKISLKPHIGSHQHVVEVSALRFRQSLEGKKEISAGETLLIIAAHGSPGPEAIEELAEFAARRVKLTPVGCVEPCFAVLGEPKLPDVLKQSASLPYKRIVIQPHLLLKGRFYDMICDMVESYRREYPGMDWIVTEPLGPDRLLAQAVVEIVDTS
jgi:sirohydrochlorin cobaltochelatase